MALPFAISSATLQVRIASLEDEWRVQKQSNYYNRNIRREILSRPYTAVGVSKKRSLPAPQSVNKIPTPKRSIGFKTPVSQKSCPNPIPWKPSGKPFTIVNEKIPSVLIKRSRYYGDISTEKKNNANKENSSTANSSQSLKSLECAGDLCSSLGKRCINCLSKYLNNIVDGWTSEERNDKRLIVKGLQLVRQGIELAQISDIQKIRV